MSVRAGGGRPAVALGGMIAAVMLFGPVCSVDDAGLNRSHDGGPGASGGLAASGGTAGQAGMRGTGGTSGSGGSATGGVIGTG
ncbi:MAG TPA: bifunctional metallophosphatase/5'-nucleotidase, partial [Polyangia bacterium]|nr:bifunctional metallophosphatase/5'-nucleotidase [Polyangia bacterium]